MFQEFIYLQLIFESWTVPSTQRDNNFSINSEVKYEEQTSFVTGIFLVVSILKTKLSDLHRQL